MGKERKGIIMGLITKVVTGLEKVLTNGKTIKIADVDFAGKAKRFISVFDKDGKLLKLRTKYTQMERNWGDNAHIFKRNYTLDKNLQNGDAILRERSIGYHAFLKNEDHRGYGIFDTIRSGSRDTKYVIDTTKPYLNHDGTVDKYTMRAISVNDTRKSNYKTYIQKNVKLNVTNPFNVNLEELLHNAGYRM